MSEKDIAKLSYEQAFEELESIIQGLEEEQKTLEESLNLFARGQQLAHYCAKLLEEAELKLTTLGQEPTG